MTAVIRSKVTHVQDHDFVKGRFLGFGKSSTLLSWLVSGEVFFLKHPFMLKKRSPVHKTLLVHVRSGKGPHPKGILCRRPILMQASVIDYTARTCDL